MIAAIISGMHTTAGNGPVPSFGRAMFTCRCWLSGFANSMSRSNTTFSGTTSSAARNPATAASRLRKMTSDVRRMGAGFMVEDFSAARLRAASATSIRNVVPVTIPQTFSNARSWHCRVAAARRLARDDLPRLPLHALAREAGEVANLAYIRSALRASPRRP
jgi:hypothetical protein